MAFLLEELGNILNFGLVRSPIRFWRYAGILISKYRELPLSNVRLWPRIMLSERFTALWNELYPKFLITSFLEIDSMEGHAPIIKKMQQCFNLITKK